MPTEHPATRRSDRARRARPAESAHPAPRVRRGPRPTRQRLDVERSVGRACRQRDSRRHPRRPIGLHGREVDGADVGNRSGDRVDVNVHLRRFDHTAAGVARHPLDVLHLHIVEADGIDVIETGLQLCAPLLVHALPMLSDVHRAVERPFEMQLAFPDGDFVERVQRAQSHRVPQRAERAREAALEFDFRRREDRRGGRRMFRFDLDVAGDGLQRERVIGPLRIEVHPEVTSELRYRAVDGHADQ